MTHVFKIGELKTYNYGGKPNYEVIDQGDKSNNNKLIIGQQDWMSFALSADGLFGLLSDDGELIKEEPGFSALTKKHMEKIDTAYSKISELPENHQKTLEWLRFWVDWSLKNCKQPVIANWFI